LNKQISGINGLIGALIDKKAKTDQEVGDAVLDDLFNP
jgi:hypothetical protein